MWVEVVYFIPRPDQQKPPLLISYLLTLPAGGLQGDPVEKIRSLNHLLEETHPGKFYNPKHPSQTSE